MNKELKYRLMSPSQKRTHNIKEFIGGILTLSMIIAFFYTLITLSANGIL